MTNAGAGKTSVINTIFRLMELDQGGIFIDGVEIAKLGLAQLRNAMAIIPQVIIPCRPPPNSSPHGPNVIPPPLWPCQCAADVWCLHLL